MKKQDKHKSAVKDSFGTKLKKIIAILRGVPLECPSDNQDASRATSAEDAGYPGLFTETLPYKGTWVYATQCKLINKIDNTEKAVYLPAVHKSAYPFLSNLVDGFVAADNSGKYDQEALTTFRKKLDTILNDLSSIYTKHTGREVQIRVDDVELLPIGGKDHSENVYSIESIEDPAMSKHEAYHIAMDLVDLFRIQQQVDAKMKALKKDKHA